MRSFTKDPKLCPNIGISLNKRLNRKKISKKILLYIPRKKPGYDTIFFLGIIKFSKLQIRKYIKKYIINNFINYIFFAQFSKSKIIACFLSGRGKV